MLYSTIHPQKEARETFVNDAFAEGGRLGQRLRQRRHIRRTHAAPAGTRARERLRSTYHLACTSNLLAGLDTDLLGMLLTIPESASQN